MTRATAGVLSTLAFSSLWLAAAASALAAAAARCLSAPVDLRAVGLAAAGTLVVYNVDRLRDVERDRATSPRRTAFVERQRGRLVALTGASAAVAGLLVLACGAQVALLLAPVAAAGLLHRRLKRLTWAKAGYVAGAWLVVVVGVPALLAPAPRHTGWVLGAFAAGILANAIVSNVRDREAGAARIGAARALAAARGLALVGTLLGAAAPWPARAAAVVPLATLLALLPFRADERYGQIAVDGALLLGALAALALTA